MASGASGFGAFAGGLWQGASSAMQLASAFRNLQITSQWADAAKQTADAMSDQDKQNQQPAPITGSAQAGAIATPGTPDQTQTPGGTSGDTGTQQAGQLERERQGYDTTDQGPVSPDTTQAAPKKPTAKKDTALTGSGIPASWLRSDQGIRMAQAAVDAARVPSVESVAKGETTPLATGPVANANAPAPGDFSNQTGLPLPSSGAPAPAPTTARAQPAIGGAPFNAAGVQGAPGGPSGGPAYRPDQNIISRGISAIGDVLHGPSSGFTAQPAAPAATPTTAQPVQPSQAGPTVGTGGIQGAPGGPSGAAPAAPTPITPGLSVRPVSQAQPQSTVGRVLAAVNPNQVSSDVGAIQAGMQGARGAGVQTADITGTAGAQALGQALAQAKQTGQDVPVGNTGVIAHPDGTTSDAPAAQPIAPAMVNAAGGGGATAPHPPVTTAAPTTRAATALPPTPAPVAVTGPGTKVAPDQKGPSVQSEPTPPAGPAPSHAAFDKLSKADQDYLTKVAKEDGQGQVSPYQLAAVWDRESGSRRANVPNGSAGEIGPFQIKPGTWSTVDPQHELNINTFEGAARAAARYYAHIQQSNYPAFSPAQDAAYMAGEAGARNWAGLTPAQQQSVMRMRVGFDGSKDGWNNYGPKGTDQQVMTTVLNAGNRGTPDDTLRAIIDTTASGIPMSQKWRIAEASTVRAMIMSGHPEAIGQVQEWFAQQSHQGALSNMYSGYQALRGGSPETAALFFSKAHAFFPDGTFARFSAGPNHTLWAQVLDENTHTPMGTHFQITPETVQEEMMRISKPNNFMDKLLDMRAKTAEIQLHQAQTGYYLARPGLQQAAIDERAREADERSADRAAAREATETNRQAIASRHEDTVQQQLDADRRPVDANVTKRYDETDPGAVGRYKGQTDDQYAGQQQAEAVLRYPQRAGGAGMGTKSAENAARGLMQGKLKLVHDKDGKGYSLHDADEKNPSKENSRGFIGEDQGQLLGRLPGVLSRPGAAALPANAGPLRTSAIGSGAGSPYALMQGIGTTYGGVQTIPLPQQQPQQSATV